MSGVCGGGGSSFLLLAAFVHPKLKHDRQNRDQNQDNHRDLEVLFDGRNGSQEHAGEHTNAHPHNATDDVVDHELGELHCPHARHEGSKRPHYWNKASDDDGFSAIVVEKFLGLGEVLGRKELGVGIFEAALAEEASDPVIHDVAPNGGGAEQDEHSGNADAILFVSGDHSNCEKEGVAGKEWQNDKGGLGKDDPRQDNVDPNSVGLNQLNNVLVYMPDVIDHKS